MSGYFTHQLPGGQILGERVANHIDGWQMDFLDESGLARYAHERGMWASWRGDDVRLLWSLGLLQADMVTCAEKLQENGLILVGEEKGQYLYADERQLPHNANGWARSAAETRGTPESIQLSFHPFRSFVLSNLERLLKVSFSPTQLLNADSLTRLLDWRIRKFDRFSAQSEFPLHLHKWTRTAALAILAEPCSYARLFGVLRKGFGIDWESLQKEIDHHWQTVSLCYRATGPDRLEEHRQDLCIAAETLDPNKNVHTMLRLTQDESRIKLIKGRLGGAMCLLAMAETIRRATEREFGIELREEDELGFGMMPLGVKRSLYGADRVLDADRGVKNQFLRTFNLDYGVRLRWYVEGETEYYAIKSISDLYGGIQLFNLCGQVTAGRRKGLGFRDDLRNDLTAQIYSYVSVDGDRPDVMRPLRRAAEDDEICGMFFLSEPDFEFQNFTIEELEEILWQLAKENGAHDETRQQLSSALAGTSSGEVLLREARRALPELSQTAKGEEWGRRLMAFAWENPLLVDSNSGTRKERMIVEAVQSAIRSTHSDYHLTRSEYRVDPTSGKLVRRT